MIVIPCEPNQAIWCVGKRTSEGSNSSEPARAEVVLAETRDQAQRCFEAFWGVPGALFLSQEDVGNMLDVMERPAAPRAVEAKASFSSRLLGRRSAPIAPSEKRYFVFGVSLEGKRCSAVVSAPSEAAARDAAVAQNEKMLVSGAFSENQLRGVHTLLEKARTGKSVARIAGFKPKANESGGEEPQFQTEGAPSLA